MRADRMLTALIVISVLLALLTGLRPDWLNGGASRRDPRPPMEVVIPPGKEFTVRFRRIQLKRLAIDRLWVGELTLFEAAAVFHHLNTTPPGLQDESWRTWPGADDGERQCRQVIHWATLEWQDRPRPEESKARVGRLARELKEHIAAHGGVRLPCHVPEE